MKSIVKTIQIASLAVALVFSLAAPQVSEATVVSSSADLLSSVTATNGNAVFSTSGNSNTTGNTANSNTSTSGTITQFACAIAVSDRTVEFGGATTFSWNASDFNSLTFNGSSVSASAGSYTVSNITSTTIFQIAGFDRNGNPCAAQIIITCNPIPVDCRLEINKAVNKTSAVPGEELTYTISIRNIGSTNCTGSGVKIVDVLDPNIEYLRHSLTSNLIAGYDAGSIEYDVYEAGSRTLYFNGDVLTPGESGTITWVGRVKTPSQCGDFEVKNQAKATALELNNFLTWVRSQTVTTAIDYDCPNPSVPSCDSFTASPNNILTGSSATLSWETSNATRVAINNGIGNVSADGSVTVTPLVSTTYTLSVFDGNNNLTNSCTATVTVSTTPVPSCDSFTATPSTIVTGSSATLTWETTNANTVRLNNGIGAVAVDGSRVVSPTTNTTYVLTVIGAQDQAVDCSVTVTVSEDPVPVCKSFTASPSALPVGGGDVTFNWEVENASSVVITPTIGTVGLTGSRTLNVTSAGTYTLTATDTNGDEVSCSAPVTVADPVIFTCAANVDFSVNDSSIRRGEEITLNWNVTGADSVSISSIGSVSSTGSQSFSPSSDTTYTLTATNDGVTINCPVRVDVSTGGGGGGSSSPRCDLDISDNRITRGESVTLRWDTSRATEIKIIDNRGNIIVTTEDKLRDDKEDLYDGSIRVTPTRDTQYTLIAERGSRDRECEVEVEVEGGQVLGQVRDQQPLVAGIALSQVPYTGFEAGPVLTLMFYLLLMAWALYIAYYLVVRKESTVVPSSHLASTADLKTMPGGTSAAGDESMKKAETIRPDAFASVAPAANTETPANLPTAEKTIGYESFFAGNSVTETQADQIVTDLENRAHSQRALLSSDAVSFFMTATEGSVDRNEELDRVISEAKTEYPLEDGWIVLNKTRMQNLCEVKSTSTPAVGESLPDGTGSLAEAIVTGNIVAAYEMIGNRPMFALAQAAADLDSVVRNRKGDNSPISDLLLAETKELSDEQLQNMINALTGAIDGTYTDEASAVKMSIMKAVKEIA